MSLEDFQRYVERVREASPLLAVVEADGHKFRKSGNHHKCRSPFREERTPSFAVYDDGHWHDYGVSETGDVFSYVEQRDNCDFRTAVDWLAARAGVEPWKGAGGIDPATRASLEALLESRWVHQLLDEASHYYHKQLTPSIRRHIREKWGFPDWIVDEYRIGWADGALHGYMTATCGHDFERLKKTGLFIYTRERGWIDFYRDRVVFPYLAGGTCRYMIGRRVDGITSDDDYEKGKYKKLLTGDNHDYVSRSVQNILYGLDSIRGARVALVTEGITDAISLLATRPTGYGVVSPVTVAFKEEHVPLLLAVTQHCERIVLCNDNEEPRLDQRTGRMRRPGLDGALKTARLLAQAGRNVRVMQLPRAEGEAKVDVNEYLRDAIATLRPASEDAA